MQPSANFLKPWIYLSKQRFQALLIVGFLIWSSLLIIETVNVQHSCTPMMSLDRKLPDRCLHTVGSGNETGTNSRNTSSGNGAGTTSLTTSSNGTGTNSQNTSSGNGTGTSSKTTGSGNGTGTSSQGIQEFITQHPNETIIAVAGVGVGIAAIAGAPILVIVGVGIGIFGLATKYALPLAKHTLPPM